MAGSSFFALFDDIATILDDVALMTRVAAKKTAGVLGDDLALNAQQVAGVNAARELPVVWSVAKGSFRNKLILVPSALLVSALAPWAITPLLMAGGAYLCYEGVEKLAHALRRDSPGDAGHHEKLSGALSDPSVDMVAFEKEKIAGAVRTDFILSAEIIVIALGTVASAPFAKQVAVISAVAVAMTVGVYGLVAAIVKLDDAGLYLGARSGEGIGARLQRAAGAAILAAAPGLMKSLSVVGTAAMFLVGGGILAHGIPGAERIVDELSGAAGSVPGVGAALSSLATLGADAAIGIGAGIAALGAVRAIERLAPKRA